MSELLLVARPLRQPAFDFAVEQRQSVELVLVLAFASRGN